MAQGLEVYNADGSLQFDIGNRLFRSLTIQTTAGTAGSVTITGASTQGTITVTAVMTDSSDDAIGLAPSVSGDTVSWGAGAASRLNIMAY